MKSAVLILLTLSAAVSARVVQVSEDVYEVSPRARYVVQTAMTWGAAYKSCKSRNSNLVVINSQLEANDLVAIVGMERVFVGVHDKYIPGKYVTITDEALGSTGYDQWYGGAPHGGPGKCITHTSDMVTHGLWDVDCTETFRSICEDISWSDYNYIEPYGYYKWHSAQVNWMTAKRSCRQQGTHLMIINSQAEINAVYTATPDLIYYRSWTGVHRIFHSKEYVTVFNDKLSGTGWNQFGGKILNTWDTEDYVSVFRNESLGSFTKNEKCRYLCERERVQS